MALLTVDELREHVTTALSEDAVQLLLDAAEQAIEQVAGPLVESGDVTEVLEGGTTYLVLRHPASTFTSVTERVGSTDTLLVANDYRLSWDGRSVRRLDNGDHPQTGWLGTVTFVFPPADDLARRKVAQIALLKLYIDHHPGVASETIGDWQQSFQSNSVWNYAQERDNILSTLAPLSVGFA